MENQQVVKTLHILNFLEENWFFRRRVTFFKAKKQDFFFQEFLFSKLLFEVVRNRNVYVNY